MSEIETLRTRIKSLEVENEELKHRIERYEIFLEFNAGGVDNLLARIIELEKELSKIKSQPLFISRTIVGDGICE